MGAVKLRKIEFINQASSNRTGQNLADGELREKMQRREEIVRRVRRLPKRLPGCGRRPLSWRERRRTALRTAELASLIGEAKLI